ncbi:MAG: tRNA (guanosine(37)-N1)-methyltransferase TrmD [Sphingomonadaceae bacterium]
MSTTPWTARIITLYPEMFPGPLGISLAGRALSTDIWRLETLQLRDFATDRHRSVDDTPAGGGPGMVLRVDVLARAVDAVRAANPAAPVLALTPRGPRLTQQRVRELAAGPGVALLCGRFEGFDERIFAGRAVEPVAIGDFILSGGELGAMMLVDACVRLLPGVMGAASSGDEESFETGLLEHPHYTRPARWEGHDIPDVLRSGDHAAIAAWRRERAMADTRLWRPDLWKLHGASPSGT